jgi:hypothetical protein
LQESGKLGRGLETGAREDTLGRGTAARGSGRRVMLPSLQ